jgi:DNA polymerase elongation subunit (family B)
MKYAHKDGVMLPDKKDNSKEKFEGAIVYDTVAGRHGWVSTIDLNQLYPATIMMLGLSPDTMIMELDDGYDDYVRVMSKSDDIIGVRILDRGVEAEYVEIKASELESIIRENGYTVSAAGIVFSGEFGFLARYVKYVTDQRSVYKNKMKEAMNANNKYEYELNNLYQKVIKILANSIYGCSGEVSFRLFDLRLSRSITLTARIISKWQAWKGNDVINQLKEE